MALAATYKDILVEIYEQYEDSHAVSAGEDTANQLTVTGKVVHLDASGNGEEVRRTRVYIDGVQATLTEVSQNGADIKISIASLTEGEYAEIYVPTATGTLDSNTTHGKLTLPSKQAAFTFDSTGDTLETGGLGTASKDTYVFATAGSATLALETKNSTSLKDLTSARLHNKFVSLVIQDTSQSATEYRILNACNVTDIGQNVINTDNVRGILMTTYGFGFKPEVEVSDT